MVATRWPTFILANSKPKDMPLSFIQQQLVSVLKNPDNIRMIDRPTEKVQLVAVQKNPELIRFIPDAGEKVQLVAVMTSPETVFLMQVPTPLACFMAVERLLDVSLLPAPEVLSAAENLVRALKDGLPESGPATIRQTPESGQFLEITKPYKI